MTSHLAEAAALAVAVCDQDDATAARILASLDRRGLYAVAKTLAANVDLARPIGKRVPLDRVPLEVITDMIGAYYGLTLDEMRAKDRGARSTRARAVAYRTARLFGWSTPAIGRHFGRDHTTVVMVSRRCSKHPQMEEEAVTFVRRIRAAQIRRQEVSEAC